MLHQDSHMVDPIFKKFTMQMEATPQPAPNVDLFRLWGTHFSLVGHPAKKISIPLKWAPFFTIKLLKKESFEWARNFLGSSAWSMI
jgi:hypothetical protein